jgi:hypothetical protein
MVQVVGEKFLNDQDHPQTP